MKTFADLFKTAGMILLGAALVLSCKKNGSSQDGGNNGNNTNSANADSISGHLQFFDAQKIQGAAPKGSSGSALKISFKDTLFLVDPVKLPIKFLHMDTTQNVTGVFIQVMGLVGGSVATSYFDVPEVPGVDTVSDTVSVIMMGIDPTGLKLPFDFNITITPHNSSGQPLAQITRPVRIVEHNTSPTPKGGSCGIVLPPSKIWDWDCTYKLAGPGQTGQFSFFNDPNTIFIPNGQMINGSCCGGTSVYGFCPGEKKPNRSLHFATYYRILEERFIFDDQNSYFRLTGEDAPTPVPSESNFCAGGEGKVRPGIANNSYTGDYSIIPVTPPADLQAYHDSLGLILTVTGSTGGGFGNGGGIIHELDCKTGRLILIQVDAEGFGQHLFKCYSARFPDDPKWNNM
jgi:hypothetical protein